MRVKQNLRRGLIKYNWEVQAGFRDESVVVYVSACFELGAKIKASKKVIKLYVPKKKFGYRWFRIEDCRLIGKHINDRDDFRYADRHKITRVTITAYKGTREVKKGDPDYDKYYKDLSKWL